MRRWTALVLLFGPVFLTQSRGQAVATTPPSFVANILVDQFGYRPQDAKVAVIRDPRVGFDAASHFDAGPTYQVINAKDGSVAFSGAPKLWENGKVEPSSGDRGWWFDFSGLRTPGQYYVYDAHNAARSAVFRIDAGVYRGVLKAAVRMYYYQRSGIAKQLPCAESCWVDEAAYLGPNQDIQAHDVTDRDNPAKVRDLSGGWFDAGDTNKYVTFAATAVHQLLTAYERFPGAFSDDFNIPESGNGIPDLIDEVNWEVQWLQKMQYRDGSAALKVGDIVDSLAAPPSSDHNSRFYVPSCTSATIAAAGMFAHASYVFGKFQPLATEAGLLQARAVAAWNNFSNAPRRQEACDAGIVKAAKADWPAAKQGAEAVVAAVYLFAITADPQYSQFVAAHYKELRPFNDFGWSRYDPEQGDALMFFSTLSNIDPGVKKAILDAKSGDVDSSNEVYGFSPSADLYRAYMHDPQYHWGSNQVRANYGNSNLDAMVFGLKVGKKTESLEERALGLLHYMHGVNPFGMVYLSNMSRFGATRSASEIYHTWYTHNSRWNDAVTSQCGPAPGYLTGGPNANAVKDGVPADLVPPANQPPQKSYRDWNAGWPQSAWAVTEPAIYYQSAYVVLLSAFAQQQ